MAKKQLDPATSKRVATLLKHIDESASKRRPDFDPPRKLKQDASNNATTKLAEQRPRHRTLLLILIGTLSAMSFLFLVFIVTVQMLQRIENPDYTGVSDTVISVLTTGVFAELIGTVAVIAKEVWKDPK